MLKLIKKNFGFKRECLKVWSGLRWIDKKLFFEWEIRTFGFRHMKIGYLALKCLGNRLEKVQMLNYDGFNFKGVND